MVIHLLYKKGDSAEGKVRIQYTDNTEIRTLVQENEAVEIVYNGRFLDCGCGSKHTNGEREGYQPRKYKA